MNGREQPYLNGNGTGTYEATQWLDDVPGIQEGTPAGRTAFQQHGVRYQRSEFVQ